MSEATGRPRPFLAGVFRTACNYCVRSKKGCSGGNPCDQCQKQGKNCVYAQRRMSGPRGRPSDRPHRMRSIAKARRENRAAAKAAQSTQPAYLESSIFVKQGNEDGSSMNVPRQRDNISTGALGGHYGHQLLLPIPQDYYHSMESSSSGWRSSSIETTNESLPSIYSSDDGGYPPSDGDGTHTSGKNEGDDKPGLVLEGPSGDIMNIAAMEDFPTRGTGFSSGGGNSKYWDIIGVACHDGIQDVFGSNTAGGASGEQQKDQCVRSVPLTKVNSSSPSMLGNSLGNDYPSDKYDVFGCWREQKSSISVRDSVDPRKSAFAKSSSTRYISSPPAHNGNCTQGLDSMSPISEVPRQLKREVTPIEAPLGVIPTSSQSGGLNLQSPVAIDDLLLVGCFPNWTEQDSIQLEREQSADLYHGGGSMFSGHVIGRKQQDLPHHHQKQQQQQQNASQEVFLWKDEDVLDKLAFAAAAVAANADVSLIKKIPPPRINIGQPLIDPPLHQSLFAKVIPPVSLPSSTGGADISPATLGRRSTDSRFVDALLSPQAKLPRREIGLEAHVPSPIISGRTIDEGGVDTVFEHVDDTASPPISIESAILMDLDRSMKVAAGTELHDDFVDLDCAIMADMRTPLTHEASLIRAMEAVGSEVVLGANSSNDMSAFARLW